MPCRIKIVPDNAPNAEGEWRKIEEIDVHEPIGANWADEVARLSSFVPSGFHIVSINRTNWVPQVPQPTSGI